MSRDSSLRKVIQEVAQVIRLFEASFTNFDNIAEILPNVVQEFPSNVTFATEESSKWVVTN